MSAGDFWPLLLQIYPPTRYQAPTEREIPLILLHPIDTALYGAVPAL